MEGYLDEEVVDFCTKYMQQQPIGVPLSKHEGMIAGEGSASVGHHPPRDLVDKAHFTVLHHMTEVHPFIASRENRGVFESFNREDHQGTRQGVHKMVR